MFYLAAESIQKALEKIKINSEKYNEIKKQDVDSNWKFLDVAGDFNETNVPFCLIGEEPTFGESKIKYSEIKK